VPGHPLHGVLRHASTKMKVAPQTKNAEIKRGDWPYDIHDPHPLGMPNFVDADDNSADEGGPQRYPRNKSQHDLNPIYPRYRRMVRDRTVTADSRFRSKFQTTRNSLMQDGGRH
jgi:hypothetical protein